MAASPPGRLRPWRFAAVLLLAAAWSSAGPQPVLHVLADAWTPTDFTRDYVHAHAFLHPREAPPRTAPQEALNAYAASIGAARVPLLGAPYHFHPPPALFPVLPLALLAYRAAAIVWLALSVAALAWLARSLSAIFQRREDPSPRSVAAVFGLLLLWPPVLHNLAEGQWSIVLAALIAAGWRALERGRDRAAGGLLAAAACLKATPVLLFGFLALRRRSAAAVMAAVLAAAALMAAAVEGVDAWRAFAAAGPQEVAAWQTYPANTASLNGFFARLFAGGRFIDPVVAAPRLARALTYGASALLLAVVAALSAGRAARAAPQADRPLFAAWLTLTVLVNPLGWTHNLVLLAPALALVGRPSAGHIALLACLSVPSAALTVGSAALGRSLVSLHAAAALGVLAVALRAARQVGRGIRPP